MKRNNFLKLGIGIPLLGMLSFKPSTVLKKNPVIEFTPESISEYNVGLYVIEDRANLEEFMGVGVGCVWKLVYQLGYAVNNLQGEKVRVKFPKYGMCNVLTDGWTHWVGSKDELCEYLNNNKFGAKYRILTPEELIYIIKNRSNQKQIVRHVI